MKEPRTTLALLGRGILLGAAASAVLASIYAAAAPLGISAYLIITNTGNGKIGEALLGAAALGICAGPFAFVLGILPGTLLGALCGLLIALLIAPWRRTLSPAGGALIGLLVASVLVTAANLTLGPGMIEQNQPAPGRYLPYLLWIAGPSLLILLGLPWVGWTLRREITLPWRRRQS